MPESSRHPWAPSSPWPSAIRAGRGGRQEGPAQVWIEPLDNIGLSTLILQGGQREPFATFVMKRWGFALPDAGRAAFGAQAALIWSGPGQWLAVAETLDELADLPEQAAGLVAVTDQGDSRALVNIGGPAARSMLQKGLAIDLAPEAFTAGSTAVTALMHLSVQIWQTDDDPVYVLSVPRSVAGSVWEWLTSSAAEFGFEVRQPG